MKYLIIYHSETGNTRRVAEYIHDQTDSDMIELKPKKSYSKFGMYTSGIKKVLKQQEDDIGIAAIDISAYDGIIVGTPVWAGRPTPVVSAGLNIIKDGEGKKAVAFSTFRGSDGETQDILRKKLEDAGLDVVGTYGFKENETKDSGIIDGMMREAGL